MKKIIKETLRSLSHKGPLHSRPTINTEYGRELIADTIMRQIRTQGRGWFLDLGTYNGKLKEDADYE
jgi:hypothetical protein